MAKRCKRGEKLGPDGHCYSKKDYKKKFSRASDSLGALETKCPLPGGNRRVRVCVTSDGKPGKQISDPFSVCQVLRGAENADRESFYVLYLDSQNRVSGIEEAHKGTASHVEVHPREVFKGAVATNARAVVLAHNHPSGSPTPSNDDHDLTRRLVKSGELLGIPVLDHVIVSTGGCTSIREGRPDMFSGVDPLGLKKGE